MAIEIFRQKRVIKMVAYKTNNIKALRKSKDWTQEEMAQKLNMSKNGYAQIERGDNNVSLENLKRIADLFEINVVKLIEEDAKGLIILIGDNSHSSNNNYCSDPQSLSSEIDKLNLIIKHQQDLLTKEQAQHTQLLAQKDEQINTLNLLIKALEKNNH